MKFVKIEDFKEFNVFKDFCETLERGGFVLNPTTGRYEATGDFTGADTNRFAGQIKIKLGDDKNDNGDRQ